MDDCAQSGIPILPIDCLFLSIIDFFRAPLPKLALA